MDWTHALVACFSAALGAVAYRRYEQHRRQAYWANLGVFLRAGRRKHSMRTKPLRGRRYFYGHRDGRLEDLFK